MTRTDHDAWLQALSKNARRRLARFACAWCDHQLDKPGCSAIYGSCSHDKRISRAKDCLENYKPRKP